MVPEDILVQFPHGLAAPMTNDQLTLDQLTADHTAPCPHFHLYLGGRQAMRNSRGSGNPAPAYAAVRRMDSRLRGNDEGAYKVSVTAIESDPAALSHRTA
jgi:hypothetical protein